MTALSWPRRRPPRSRGRRPPRSTPAAPGAGRCAAAPAASRPARSSRSTNVARSPRTSRSAGTSQATTGVPQASASTVRQAEALVVGGEDERAGAGVDRGEVVVGDVAGERDVGQLVRPGLASARRARAAASRGASAERGDALARVGVLEAADPDAGSRRAARSARARRRPRRRLAGRIAGAGGLGDDDDALAVDVEALDARRRRRPRSGRSRAPRAARPGSAAGSAGRCAGTRCGA